MWIHGELARWRFRKEVLIDGVLDARLQVNPNPADCGLAELVLRQLGRVLGNVFAEFLKRFMLRSCGGTDRLLFLAANQRAD